MSNILTCRICGCTADHPQYIAKETIMGSFERFCYFKCLDCGCLQIVSIPKNLGKYYSLNYHSRILELGNLEKKEILFLKKRIARLILFSGKRGKITRNLFGKLFPGFLWQFGELGINQKSRILDYGCGRAHFLLRLYGWGFENLLGLDPYIQNPQRIKDSVVIKKGDYTQLSGFFELIILNHVIEHLEEPLGVLKALSNHLSDKGTLIVNTPLVDSYGWRKFGNSWAMWDAPRHLHLFTVKSMAIAAQKCGLKIVKLDYDVGNNIWETSRLFSLSPEAERIETVSQKELERRQKKIKKFLKMLDALGDSDMASFYLRKS
ncbi:class I SAM-dependent methyltransferase [Methylacidiphilum caldifontis]|uniref:class I SAM-dependent methyltransferase n=1 Tax=Methylacidiphilum caldifontis TaxID=2795386 RepID=UPI001A8D3695|nr:class I SAM-dependent methyltransferase [Methylacidiphilum caldifontis]QSR88279.1 class I SAM-dependent methyltransferase [Methylacidiphilum caldifontis]